MATRGPRAKPDGVREGPRGDTTVTLDTYRRQARVEAAHGPRDPQARALLEDPELNPWL